MKKYSVVAFLGLVSQAFFAWGDGVQVFRNDGETDGGVEFGSLAAAWAAIPNGYQGEQCVVIRLESNQGLSETLTIEEGVTRLGSENFRGFDKLETVTASADLVGLGDYAFWQCPSLTTVTLKTTQEVSVGTNAYPIQIQREVTPQENWVQFVFEPYTNLNNYAFYYAALNDTNAVNVAEIATEDRAGVSEWMVPEPAVFDVTLTWDEHIAEVSYTIGGEAVVVDDLDAGAITIEDLEPGTVVTVAATAKDWYKVTSGTGSVTIDEDGKTVEITTEVFGSLEEVGIENLPGISFEEAKEWADEKELTPAEIAACDFAFDAYLMNCGLDAKPELKIVGIEEVEGGWMITVKGTAGEADIDLGNLNGPIKVKAAATLDELKDAEAEALDIDVREAGAAIKVVGNNKNFMKVLVTR